VGNKVNNQKGENMTIEDAIKEIEIYVKYGNGFYLTEALEVIKETVEKEAT
jgi:hypothetical protein